MRCSTWQTWGANFQQIQRELKVAESSFNQFAGHSSGAAVSDGQSEFPPGELMTSMDASNVAAVDNVNRKLVLSGVVAVLLGAAVALFAGQTRPGLPQYRRNHGNDKAPSPWLRYLIQKP